MSVKPVAWTPGPWETHYSHDVTGYPCFFIHGMSGQGKTDDATLTANARLIASAPELYADRAELAEALRMLYEETKDYITINNLGDPHHNQSMQIAHELLARITPK